MIATRLTETQCMTMLRVLAVLLLGSVASAQIGTPPACQDAVTDRKVFQVEGARIKFHLKFHTAQGAFDARSVVKLHRREAPDASCNDGDVLDVVIDELIRERNQFLPAP
jgi:hypothetical protein